MFTVRRRFRFCCAHLLSKHHGKCLNLHGHNYELVVHVVAPTPALDDADMVVDFGIVKKAFKTWIDENWDHAFLYNTQDERSVKIARLAGRCWGFPQDPTAEVMARFLLVHSKEILSGYSCRVDKIKLWETADCSVEVM